MYFNENIRVLRKEKGFSQEQLAQELNVSRQAVSKWESEGTYPEMDTLLAICELFEVNMDDLIKKDLSHVSIGKSEDALYCINAIKQFALQYAIGVCTIVFGVAMYLFIEMVIPEDSAQEYITNIVFMIFLIVGVLILIYTGIHDEKFKKQHPNYPSPLLTQKEELRFHQLFSIAMVSGVGSILFGVVLQMLLDEGMRLSHFANGIFMLFICVAVFIFIYFGVQKERYEESEQAETITNTKKNEEMLIGVVCGVIMIFSTIIFFIWSFLFEAWKISWIVYPIGGMFCGISTLIIYGCRTLKKP